MDWKQTQNGGKVVINGKSLNWLHMTRGVSQGSDWSFYCLMYTNGIENTLICRITKFIDDIIIGNKVITAPQQQQMQNKLDRF